MALIVGCAGCAHGVKEDRAPTQAFTLEEWSNRVTSKGLDVDSVVYPFRVTPAMEAWIEGVFRGGGSLTEPDRLELLQRALFDRAFEFSYDDALTLTADQAFEARRGNCLSFTVLFVALARSAGVPTFLLSVRRGPNVNEEEDLVVINEHVVAAHRGLDRLLVFDFFLTSEEPFVRQQVVDDVMATAMYYNNVGGLAIRDGDLEKAQEVLPVTTSLAPDWPPGWTNLGVARFRSGDTEGALEAYGAALEVAPDNPSALTNLAHVYSELGLDSEADSLLRAAAGKSNHPFTLIVLADSERRRGNYDEAAELLRQARKKDRNSPEVWEAMARLARHRNDPSKADRYHAKAEKLRRKQAKQEAARTPRPGFPIDSQWPPRGPR